MIQEKTSRFILLLPGLLLPCFLNAQSAYFGGKGDGYAMASTGTVMVGLESNRLNQAAIRLWPNPVRSNGNLQLKILSYRENITFQLISPLGQIIKQGELASSRSTHQIPLETLYPGIYLLRFRKGRQQISKKVLINP